MAKINFKLKELNSKDETLIYLIFYYQYKRFKYSTGEKINPKFWNIKAQRAKETKKFPQYPEFNARLDKLENGLNNAFRRLLNDGIQPTNERLKKELEIEISDNVLKRTKKSLLSFIEDFIEESKSVKKESTVCVYKTTLKHLKNFSQTTRTNVDYEDINISFYSKFTKYLSIELDMSNNTVGKYIKTIKTFLNEATERGLNENLDYKKRKFKTLKEDTDKVYLDINELKTIQDKDFSNRPNLERTRDLFLIACFTGLRFSDFSQLKPENINEDKSIIQVRTQKTNEKVSIPMHSVVKNILEKYNNSLPKAFTNQTMNRYLKEVMKLCEINNPIEIASTNSGIVKKTIVPKFKLITTHTARRSFATNLYLADIPSISIMKITGHKTEKSFLKYIRISQEQNADKLLNHPFFN